MEHDRLERLKHLQKLIDKYQVQIRGLENAIVLADPGEKVRLQQRLEEKREDLKPVQAEYQQLLQASEDPKTIVLHPFEPPTGTMSPDSSFYVERQGDRLGYQTIEGRGVTLSITGARQVGKSSLLMRLLSRAEKAGKRVAFVDFQVLGATELDHADSFYRWFCFQLAQELKVDDELDQLWQRYRRGGNSSGCTQYLTKHLLSQVEQPIVIALDEVERLIDAAFRSEFFGMLRSWHNRRAREEAMKRVDLVLVSSTEPYELIPDLNQSPFNVGENIQMQDFTPAEVADLNQRHGSPLTPPELARLYSLLNGQPYLVRQALYQVASGRKTIAELLDTATKEDGVFGDHLRYHCLRLEKRSELVDGLRQIVRGNGQQVSKSVAVRLEAAGLVKSETATAVPRCELYRLYFRESLG